MSETNKSKLPSDFDGERRQTDELAPENENSEQVGSDKQAQTIADQAQDASTTTLNTDSDHVKSGLNAPDAQDLPLPPSRWVLGATCRRLPQATRARS